MLTNHVEPGYYEDGVFGIRIESPFFPHRLINLLFLLTPIIDIIMAKEVKTTHKFGEKPWLGFEHVTMTPLCQKLINPSLLSDAEKKWVNDYHTEIWEKTSKYFENDELTRNWLKRETQPI